MDSNFSKKSLLRKVSASITIQAEKLSRPWRLPTNQSGPDRAILDSQRYVDFPALMSCIGIFHQKATRLFHDVNFSPGKSPGAKRC